MLRFQQLHFPTLQFLDDEIATFAKEKAKDGQPKTRQLYSLGWLGEKFEGGLTTLYDNEVQALRFAPPDAALFEIRRNTTQALAEWCLTRPFDTRTREACLEPAIAHAWVAFYVLGDYAYNPKTQYWLRGPLKIILPHAMAFKFWFNQVGKALAWKFAKIDHICNLVDRKIIDENYIPYTLDFLTDLETVA